MSEGKRGFQNRFIRFSHNCVFKKQKHPLTRSQGCEFFANFKFAYFEIEEDFGYFG